MSLEEAMVAMTAALNRNSDLLEVLTSKAKSATAAAATPKVEEPTKAEEKTEEPVKRTRAKAEEKPEEAPAKRTRTKAEKVPTDEQMINATKDFCNVEDEDEYQERRDMVKKIVSHYGVEKMSLIPDESRNEALGMLEAFKNGDDPFPKKRRSRDEDDMA